jgi:CRISPR-associated protein Csx17
VTALEMPGLAAGPMGNWLAAVGALRAQSRLDAAARLHWGPDGVPVLSTMRPAPARDLADRAAITPVITPWQSGGGWGPKDVTPAQRLSVLRSSRSPRLEAMRRSVRVADEVMQRHGGEGKDALVLRLRNNLPDEAIPWLDVAVPLRAGASGLLEAAPAPLAGSGGNDARWDLSSNYHAAILALRLECEPEPSGATADPAVARRRGLLHDLLDGTEHQPLLELSLGPYWEASEPRLANPWALVLAAEGLCAFGDAPVREQWQRAQPWTTAAGPEHDREPGWGEAWLPLWGQPMTMGEAALVLGGPAPRWRGRAALTPAQMYASLRTLGWPRGITGYLRYALAQRRGHGHVAALLDAVMPEALPPEERLTAAEAAARAGISEGTWKGYVSRGQAPVADWRDLASGRAAWAATTVDAWLAARPGQGARTDLGEAAGT